MKILILAESLRINETSSGIVSSTFIQALANSGHKVTCLYPKDFAYTVSWLENVQLVEFYYKVLKPRLIDKVPKVRALPTYFYGYSVNFKSKIDRWAEVLIKQIKEETYDLIIILGSGSEFAPHMAMRKTKIHIPWIANFHDPFPWHVYPEPYGKKRGWISSILHRNTQEIIDRATWVSFPSLLLKEHMQHFFKGLDDKSIILPHVSIKMNNLPVNEADNQVNLEREKFNMLHAGSLLGPRSPLTLLRAFHRFIQENTEHKKSSALTIIGRVAEEHKDLISFENKGCVSIIDKRISYKHSLTLLSQSDVLILLEAKANFSPFMPGKLADYIKAQKPILALTPKNSEVLRLLGSDYPYWSEIDDEEHIYQHINKLWGAWKAQKIINLVSEELEYYISAENINNILLKKIASETSITTS